MFAGVRSHSPSNDMHVHMCTQREQQPSMKQALRT